MFDSCIVGGRPLMSLETPNMGSTTFLHPERVGVIDSTFVFAAQRQLTLPGRHNVSRIPTKNNSSS